MNDLAALRSFRPKNSILPAALLLIFTACNVVREYRPNQPFVYNAQVEVVDDKVKRDFRKDLESRLYQQLHDSIAVRRVSKFFFSQLRNPAAYDSSNAEKSIAFMKALLSSLGYYRDSITYKADTVRHRDQLRTSVRFRVHLNEPVAIDSVRIALNDTVVNRASLAASLDTLQAITLRNRENSPVQKGAPFAKPLLSAELDRLVNTYRNNGYLRFTREDMLILWDTVGVGLLRPTIDPLEQAQLLEALQRRREKPVADLEFRLRPIEDSTRLTRYYIGKITLYPDLNAERMQQPPPSPDPYRGVDIRQFDFLFKYRVLTENIYLKRGQLYDQRIQQRTATRFNSLAAWRTAAIEALPRPGTDSVDMIIRLTPARKYGFDINVEGSQNLGGLFVGSNLVGLNVNLQNRNFAQRAVQATYSLGLATEVNSRITQTTQLSGGFTLVFPRVIPGFRIPEKWRQANPRTSLAASARYIHRVDYLNLTGINLSWGYDFAFPKTLWSIRFPNIEYADVNQMTILKTLIETNKSYRYIFNDGLIVSLLANITKTRVTEKTTSLFRMGFEPAGPFPSRSSFIRNNQMRFLKLDASYSQNRKLGRNSVFAWRVLGGVGYSLPYNNKDSARFFMPFFRAYFAGGANSMRGWLLRKLGPGSAVRPFAREFFPERFGDMQLEANLEYRFLVADIRGVLLNSAVYTDIGNVWYLRKNEDFPNGEFKPSRLWQDLGIAVGTGLRVDFGFIKLRLDYAYKAKDPSPEDPSLRNVPFPNWKPLGGTLQLGVDYPF